MNACFGCGHLHDPSSQGRCWEASCLPNCPKCKPVVNRATSVYTITFDTDAEGLNWVIGGLPHTLSGSGLSDNGTAFIRIRVKDDLEAVSLADVCTAGVVDEYEITTGVGIHRRVVDVDNIRRALADEH